MTLLTDDFGERLSGFFGRRPITAMEFGEGDAGVALLVWVDVTAVAITPLVARLCVRNGFHEGEANPAERGCVGEEESHAGNVERLTRCFDHDTMVHVVSAGRLSVAVRGG